MEAELKEFKAKFLELLKKDEEFRYAIAGLIGMEEILKRLDKNEKQIIKLRKDMNKGFARYDEEFKKLREDMNAAFKRHDEEIVKIWSELKSLREDMMKGFERLERRVEALGTRWGLMAEESFREGLKAVIEKEFGWKVERWVKFDSEGLVFGKPANVEVDVAMSDGKIILIEIKSHVSEADVLHFRDKAKFYEKVEGRKPDRLIIISPYVKESALELTKEHNIEVYGRV